MTAPSNISNINLKKKLSILRAKQRRVQRRYFYRSLIVSAVASLILAVVFSSDWQIKQPSQVTIEGDRFLATSAIFNHLKLSYPQSIVSLPTQKIETRLKSIPALQSVKVTKTFFPPSVKIYLQERTPVAIAISSGKIGFLDSQGVWLEPDLYNYTEANFPLAKIKVVSFQAQYSQVWSQVYRLITTYPTLEVREVYWDNAGNLALMAKNLKIILGSNNSLLEKQFATLASFPDLANNQKLQNITQIDLTNPDTPFLEKLTAFPSKN